ncbi:Phosphoenolpyruvate/pyruvate domain-containing protein [Bimuria novae-zelandiae CBS 107.79]|uniref:methylisocitrate lyase n=1 Tax=Bimuria novae-zelandiae CBS 107.79 TaxID=1447943 RepID=A0A6A5VAP4_9PLEO|nr:Phosphoenolpyruvate/pyruvate domain-containing protein [Bimuria novae-zelandiae CBS 107.79]
MPDISRVYSTRVLAPMYWVPPSLWSRFLQRSRLGKSWAIVLQQRRELAKKLTGHEIVFDWELPRIPHGQYMWKWSIKQVVDRAALAAPFGDVPWGRQDKPNKQDMHDFHMGVRAVYPDRLFAFGFIGAYYFTQGEYTAAELESFHPDIARDYGVVWQVQPIWATQGLSLHARQFAKAFVEKGMAGYSREVAEPAIESMPTDKHGKPTARGGYLADAFFDVVAAGKSQARSRVTKLNGIDDPNS